MGINGRAAHANIALRCASASGHVIDYRGPRAV